MTDKTRIPTRTKIWEMISPLIFFFVCIFACVFVVYALAGIAFSFGVADGESFDDFVLNTTIWSNLAFYVVTVFVKGRRSQRVYEKIKYVHSSANRKLWECVLAAIAAFFAAYATSALIDLSGLSDIFTTYSTSADATFAGQSPILLILTTVIAGPIAEELIFRYMVFGRMRFYLGARTGIILSALLFGLYHANLVQFIYCTVLGLIFAFIYNKFGNLWITIGAHMAINLAGIVVYL